MRSPLQTESYARRNGRSLSIHRAERGNAAKHSRLLQLPRQLLLLLSLACYVKLHADMLASTRAAHVLHHAVFRLQDAVHFHADLFFTATGYFVADQQQLQVEGHLEVPHGDQRPDDYERGKGSCQIKSSA